MGFGERAQASSAARALEAPAMVELPGGPLAYTLRRTARARGLRVTVHPERGVVVSVPPPARRGWARPEAFVARFLREREPWIRRHLGRQAAERDRLASRPALGDGRCIPFRGEPHLVVVEAAGVTRITTSVEHDPDARLIRVRPAPGERRPVARILEAWLREQAAEAVAGAVAEHAPALDVRPGAITFRDPRTRWGSCSRAGRISLSWRLVLAPPAALETVVAHELCHLRVFGHGPRFRALLAARRPDHAHWRRWLRDHAGELHAALADPIPG